MVEDWFSLGRNTTLVKAKPSDVSFGCDESLGVQALFLRLIKAYRLINE